MAYVLLSVNVGASDVMWLYNINQYVTETDKTMGIYDYENGYAVFEIQRDNENYTRGVIDKNGNVVYGPIEGANNIRILEGGKFYVEFNGKKIELVDL